MALENFLVVLREDYPHATEMIRDVVRNVGGRIELIAGDRRAVVATFDSSFAEKIRKLPYVKLVGGVTVRKREVVRKK